jgi:hypothetical protein
MAYTDSTTVYLLTNLTTSDVSSADVTSIIAQATIQLNNDINTKINREFVRPIDNTRENKIDGSNTIFYVQNWRGVYLGDMDNDGDVDISDVIVRQVTSTGTESTLTVSAIDDDDMKITLTTAPSSGVYLYIDYAYSYVRQGEVDNMVKLACTYLTAAYCYAKINIGRAPSINFGSTSLTRHMQSYNHYMERYQDMVKQILERGGMIRSEVSPLTI